MAKGPQLCGTYRGEKLPHPHWVERKLDGLRVLAHVDGEDVFFESRLGNRYGNCEHIAEKLATLDISAVIDGEGYAESGKVSWNLSSSILRSGGPHPQSRELRFIVFDIIHPDHWAREFGDPAWTQEVRRDLLEQVLAPVLGPDSPISIAERKWVTTPEEVYAEMWRHIESGAEGAVVKDPKAPYRRIRNDAWRKVKTRTTFDGTVTGVEEGEGWCKGTLGALLLKLEDGTEGKAGTGFTAAERDELWEMNRRGVLVGKAVEVFAQERTLANKRLRFPVFRRLREDK